MSGAFRIEADIFQIVPAVTDEVWLRGTIEIMSEELRESRRANNAAAALSDFYCVLFFQQWFQFIQYLLEILQGILDWLRAGHIHACDFQQIDWIVGAAAG